MGLLCLKHRPKTDICQLKESSHGATADTQETSGPGARHPRTNTHFHVPAEAKNARTNADRERCSLRYPWRSTLCVQGTFARAQLQTARESAYLSERNPQTEITLRRVALVDES